MLKAWVGQATKAMIVSITLLGYETSWADDVQLLYPDNNVSSKPILEFRARPPTTIPPSPGHAFVFIGRVLDNGMTVFYAAGGFYPENNTVKNVLLGPGNIKYKIDDMKSDQVFRVNISPEQEDLVKYILTNWDSKAYNIAWQNCVSLQRDIAKSIGLKVPEFDPKNLGAEIPSNFVAALRTSNSADKPLGYQETEAKRMEAARQKRDAEFTHLKSVLKSKEEEAAKRQEQIRRNPPGPSVQGSTGASGSPNSGAGSGATPGRTGGPVQTFEIDMSRKQK